MEALQKPSKPRQSLSQKHQYYSSHYALFLLHSVKLLSLVLAALSKAPQPVRRHLAASIAQATSMLVTKTLTVQQSCGSLHSTHAALHAQGNSTLHSDFARMTTRSLFVAKDMQH
jgi:hypothetical protein